MNPTRQGVPIIISGPSGVGKTTVIRRLLEQCRLPLVLSVSATTRGLRPGERDGVDYHFLTDQEFERRRESGDFLECFQVYGGSHWYGSLRREVTSSLEAGKWVVLDVDVKGAMAVVEQYPGAITVFLRPSSMTELERRLRGRGTESEEKIQRRLNVAREELTLASQYQSEVINESVDRAVRDICNILTQSGD